MSSDPEELEGLIGEADEPNIMFIMCLIEEFYSSKETTMSVSRLARTVIDLKATYPTILQNTIDVAGSEIPKSAQFNQIQLKEYPLLQQATQEILRRYLFFFGKDTFDQLVNEISPNIGSRISDPKLIEAVMAHQKSVVDKLTAPPSSEANTSFPPPPASLKLKSSIKHKKPSRRFASEKVIDI